MNIPGGVCSFLRNHVVVIAGLLVFCSFKMICQVREYWFQNITAEQGLPSSIVFDVVQDQQGFLWFATTGGLCKYDGYVTQVLKPVRGDSTSISSDMVSALFLDGNGTLWVGTPDGDLNAVDPQRHTVHRYRFQTANPHRVSAIRTDRNDRLWVGTEGAGLFSFDRQRQLFHQFRAKSSDACSLSSNTIYALGEDAEGNLLVGTDNGLNVMKSHSSCFIRVIYSATQRGGSNINRIHALHPGLADIVWVGTEGGLYTVNLQSGLWTQRWGQTHDPKHSNDISVTAIAEQDARHLWIGTYREGLNKVDMATGKAIRFSHEPGRVHSLADNYVFDIFTDRTATTWIATAAGISKLTSRALQFEFYSNQSSSAAQKYVGAIAEDPSTAVWIGAKGLKAAPLFEQPENDRVHNSKLLLGSRFIFTLHYDANGTLWAGTDQGLYRCDPEKEESEEIQFMFGTRDFRILSIAEDRQGIIWLGTLRHGVIGYNRISSRCEFHFLHDDEDPGSIGRGPIARVYVDRDNTLWAGTEGSGLNRLDRRSGKFMRYTHDPSTPTSPGNNRVYDIIQGKNGTLWVVTGIGLDALEPGTQTFTHFSSQEGLPSNHLLNVREDDRGNLWITSSEPWISRFDPLRKQFTNYFAEDGFHHNSVLGAFLKRTSGQFVIGGMDGYTIFHPDSIRLNTQPPPVYLTSFRIFDKPAEFAAPLASLKEITLAHNQNFFSFEFAALDYTIPSRNRYAYMLEGLDPSWVYPQDRRVAVYTDVRPGSYILSVKGTNSDGVWNEHGVSIPLIVSPPFWATWWFKGLVAAAIIGVLAAAYNYRVAKLLEMERMRVRIASDLHDDIGSRLSSIALITDMVGNHLPPEQSDRQHLTEASRAARHTADALKDIVWIINPENDKLEDIVLRMKDSAAKLLIGIDYSFDCQEGVMSSVLDMEFRRNILLIYKEALNNIAKYAHATNVHIVVKTEDKAFRLRVTDNGIGFDEARITHGNGIRNLRARATKLRGAIEIRSAPGQGTTVELLAGIP